jgi:hypothetical protein
MASTLAIGHRVHATTRPTQPTPPTHPRRSRSEAIAILTSRLANNPAPLTSPAPATRDRQPTSTATASGSTVFRAGDRTITFDASVSAIQRSEILKSLTRSRRRTPGSRGETMVTPGASVEAGRL